MKKLIITLIFVLTCNQVFAESFLDYAVDALTQQGVIKDLENIDQRVKKVDFFVLMMRNLGYSPNVKIIAVPTPFKDVKPSSWYAPYIAQAYRLGIIEKTEKFHPLRAITRIDAYKYLLKAESYTIPRVYDRDMYKYQDLLKEEERQIANKILDLGVYKPKNNKKFGSYDFLSKKDLIKTLYRFQLITNSSEDFQKVPEIKVNITSNNYDLPKIEILDSVKEQILSKYYLSDKIDLEKMMDKAIQGFVENLDDDYSLYLPPNEAQNFTENIDGSFEGIGAYLEVTDEGILVQTPIKDSPAERAGVKAGDIIRKVDGEDIKNLDVNEVVNKIKGPKGTKVDIVFEREGKNITISIIRDQIEIHSVTGEVYNQVLIIKMHQFSYDTKKELLEVFNKHWKDNLKGMIIDIRSNPGGYLNVVEDILSCFVEEGEPIVHLQFKGRKKTVLAETDQKFEGIKTAILQNKASASASEILAGTLKDYNKARIFGEVSYGKGSVQEIIQYQDGSSLKITVAEWLTGKNNPVNKLGVKPDEFIEDNPDTENDEVIKRAIDWIKK